MLQKNILSHLAVASFITVSKHILIVDDDAEIRTLLAALLDKHGFKTSSANNGAAMLQILAEEKIDLILLDILMAGDDGLTLCKKLRESSTIPIIMISAIGDAVDRVLGLEFGADDYIAKPFYPREVVARIKTLLRRCEEAATIPKHEPTIRFSGWILYPHNRRLLDANNVEVSLSVGEYVLLDSLLKHANRILNRDQLLSYIHTYHDQEVFDRSIDVQICRLRKRIESNPKQPILIKTVRGGGYMLAAQVEYE
ncbi:response regulator [soil metagenome]